MNLIEILVFFSFKSSGCDMFSIIVEKYYKTGGEII